MRPAFSPVLPVAAILAGILLLEAPALDTAGWITAEFLDETAHFPELKPLPNAHLTRDWERQYRTWAERVIAAPFEKQVQTQPWGAQAAQFVKRSLDAWHVGDEDNLHPELAEAGKALRAANCSDPLVRFFAAWWEWRNSVSYRERASGILPDTGYALTDGRAAIERLRAACEDLASANYPRGALLFFAQDVAAGWDYEWSFDHVESWLKKMTDWLPTALSEGSFGPEDAGVFVGLLQRRRIDFKKNAAAALDAIQKSMLPEWAKLSAVGDLKIDAAWAARGDGDASSVTPDGWARFKSNLEEAHTALERSWKAEPGHPETAASMLTVLGANKFGPDPLPWFQKGVGAEFDCRQLYENWLHFHRPMWGGSCAQVLAFGRACAATRRYDTNVPEQFIRAVYAVESDNRKPNVLVPRIPWIADAMMEVTLGEYRDPTRRNEASKWRSLLATRGWFAGKYELAKQAVAGLPGGKLDRAAEEELAHHGVEPWRVESELALFGTPAWADYLAGSDARREGNFQEADRRLAAALAAAPADEQARLCIQSQIVPARFLVQYSTGEWTPIPLLRPGWLVRAGEFPNDKDGALLVKSQPNRHAYLHFYGHVGLAYEIRGKFTSLDGVNTPRFGLAIRGDPEITGRFLTLLVEPKDEGKNFIGTLRDRFYRINDDGRKPESKTVEVRAENDFLARVTPKSVRLEVNGTEIVPEFAIDLWVGNPDRARIGIVSLEAKAGGARITSLEARRLDEP